MAKAWTINLIGDATKFINELEKSEKGTQSFGDKVESAGKKMSLLVSVPIVGYLTAATKAAVDDDAAQTHLAQTLQNTVGNSKELVTQVEAYITKAQKASTFTDDDLRPAFETFLTTTHSVEDSQRLLSVAMDVAAGKGIDLKTASEAVAKANEGQFGAVNRLIPGIIDMKDKTLTADQAVNQLANTFNGQAKSATETASGKAQTLKRDMGELSEKIGGQLLPVVDRFAGFMVDTLIPTLDKLSGNNGALILLGVAAVGPVLSNINKLKTGVEALNLSLDATAVKAAAALGAIGILVLGGKDLINDLNQGLEKNQGLIGKSKSLINTFLGGGADKGIFGKNFLGLRAAGGPVMGGGSYIVGEKGPELFTPGSSGMITPNNKLGGGNNYNITVQAWDTRDGGSAVVAAIKEYESTSGKAWRNN